MTVATLAACSDPPITTPAPPNVVPRDGSVSRLGRGQVDSVPGAYIVLFNTSIDNAGVRARDMIRGAGAKETWVWDGLVKGFSVRNLPTAALSALEKNPQVRLVEPVRQVYPSDTQTLPLDGGSFATSSIWSLDRIDHAGAFSFDGFFQFNKTGAGVHIYIVDSGVRGGHQQVTGRIGNGSCHVSWSLNCSETIDAIGHGTSVASAAAGSTYGVAKQATIHPVRIDGGSNGASCDDIVDGLNWVGSHVQRPAVVNLSYGGEPSCFSIRDAIDALVNFNILVFKSAGNENVDAFEDRGNRSAGSVVVGAIDRNDARSSFSNWGSTVSMMAPGQSMRLATAVNDTGTAIMSGTSFAAPLTAGVAATQLQVLPTLDAASLKANLLNNASAVTITGGSGVANRVLFSNFTAQPPPLAVQISGPTSVSPFAQCQWHASASGGTGSYTYAWSVDGQSVGTNSTQLTFTNSGASFVVGVTLSDGVNSPASASWPVSVMSEENNLLDDALEAELDEFAGGQAHLDGAAGDTGPGMRGYPVTVSLICAQ